MKEENYTSSKATVWENPHPGQKERIMQQLLEPGSFII